MTRQQGALLTIIVALFGGAILYQLLVFRQLERSSALFIGIPAILSILIVLTARTKTVTGGIFIAITLALLLVAPIIREGYVCILMASPLFYGVAALIGFAIDHSKDKRNTTLSCLALVLLPMCCEGVVPALTFHRGASAQVTRMVNAPISAVEATLSVSPRIRTKLPTFLNIGFPRPLEAHGQGLGPGNLRIIHFSGAEGHPPGDLVMRVAAHREGYVRFETVSDNSKLTHWLLWDASEITWRAVDSSHTEITWRVLYQRQLDPAWYFAPLEQWAVHDAAGFLIDANATPPGASAQ